MARSYTNHYIQIGLDKEHGTLFVFPITHKLYMDSDEEVYHFGRINFRECEDTTFYMYDKAINSSVAQGIAYRFSYRLYGAY